MERVLVLCVDRDDDIGAKAKVKGPIVGRAPNVEVATALALTDPEEADSNTIFKAIKIYDGIVRARAARRQAQIATLTGSPRLGLAADRAISLQLDRVLREWPATSCIFVSDGAFDDEIVPLVASRIKIESKVTTVVRQARELESTYITLLNKLREPYFAKLFFGVPAILILAFVVSESLGFGWRPVAGLLGLYLLVRAFSLDDAVIAVASGLALPTSRIGATTYLLAGAVTIAALALGYSEFAAKTAAGVPIVDSAAYAARAFLIFAPFLILFIFVGKCVTLIGTRRRFELIGAAVNAASALLFVYVVYIAASWIAGEAWFWQFVAATAISIITAVVAFEGAKGLKFAEISNLNIEGKEAFSESGALIGKVIGIDRRSESIVIQSPIGRRITTSFDAIVDVGEKVVIK